MDRSTALHGTMPLAGLALTSCSRDVACTGTNACDLVAVTLEPSLFSQVAGGPQYFPMAAPLRVCGSIRPMVGLLLARHIFLGLALVGDLANTYRFHGDFIAHYGRTAAEVPLANTWSAFPWMSSGQGPTRTGKQRPVGRYVDAS